MKSTSSSPSNTLPLLEVGRVTKAHGVRGEVMVVLLTDNTGRLAPGTCLYTPRGGRLTVMASRPHQDRWIVSFEEVADRTAAEAATGTLLLAEAVETPGEIYVHQLVGAPVVDTSGAHCGTVEAVQANPAADLLVLDTGALVPATFLVERRDDGTVVIDPPEGLLELT